MRIVLLVDWKVNNSNFWLKDYLTKFGYAVKLLGIDNYSFKNRKKRYGKIIILLQHLILALKGIYHSSSKDPIISWNYTIGAFCQLICKFFFIKRDILAMNLIYHPNSKFSLFKKIICRISLNYKGSMASVNAKELIKDYSKVFNVNFNKIFYLSDCYHPYYERSPFTEGENFVFAGGDSARDWNTFVSASALLSEIKFILIARKKNFKIKNLPSNMDIIFDVSKKVFNNYLKKSSIVVIPLDSFAPAGLIILLESALLEKPIIATKTFSIKNYIIDNENGFLVDIYDYNDLAKKIRLLYNNINIRKKFGVNLKNSVLNKHTPEIFVSRIIDHFLNIRN